MIELISLNFGKDISSDLQKNNYGIDNSTSCMGSLLDKRNMVSKIFQLNTNRENIALSKLSDFTLSKTVNYIEESKNHIPIISRIKTIINLGDKEKNLEALGFYNKFKEENFIAEHKNSLKKKINSVYNTKGVEGKFILSNLQNDS